MTWTDSPPSFFDAALSVHLTLAKTLCNDFDTGNLVFRTICAPRDDTHVPRKINPLLGIGFGGEERLLRANKETVFQEPLLWRRKHGAFRVQHLSSHNLPRPKDQENDAKDPAIAAFSKMWSDYPEFFSLTQSPKHTTTSDPLRLIFYAEQTFSK